MLRDCLLPGQYHFQLFDKQHRYVRLHRQIRNLQGSKPLSNCGFDGVTAHTCVVCQRVENDIDPATGNHVAYEVSPCADKCEICLLYVQKAVQPHSYYEYFTYENGYMCAGEYGESCDNEGCAYLVSEAKEALVFDLGYSIPENSSEIVFNYGYRANKKIIGEYERVNGCTVELGFLVAAGENFANDERIIEHKLTAMLDYVEIAVNYGDRTDLCERDLVIAVVLYQTVGESTVATYLQGEADKETNDYISSTYGKLYGISYNNLKN